MRDLLASVPLLLAQAAPKGGAPKGGGDDVAVWTTWWPFILVAVLFYFMIIQPQRKQERKRKELLDALKKNDRVVTTGGIFGTVVALDTDQDRVVLRVDDDKGTRITFTRSSVARVIEVTSDKEKDKTKAAETA